MVNCHGYIMTELMLRDESMTTLSSMIEYFSQPIRPREYYSADVFVFNVHGRLVASSIDDLLFHVNTLHHTCAPEEFADELYHLWGLIHIPNVGTFCCAYEDNCSAPWVYYTDDADDDMKEYHLLLLLHKDVLELMFDIGSAVQKRKKKPERYRSLMTAREQIASLMDEYII